MYCWHKFITSQQKFVHNFIHFYTLKTKHSTMEFYLMVFFFPKLVSNPFPSCSFANLDFLFPYLIHFDCILTANKSIIYCFKNPFSQTSKTFWFFFDYIFWNRKMCFLCVFYSFYNKFACFVICKNYFWFFIGFIDFKKVDFLEQQSTHVDFCCPILFSKATSFRILLCFLFTN